MAVWMSRHGEAESRWSSWWSSFLSSPSFPVGFRESEKQTMWNNYYILYFINTNPHLNTRKVGHFSFFSLNFSYSLAHRMVQKRQSTHIHTHTNAHAKHEYNEPSFLFFPSFPSSPSSLSERAELLRTTARGRASTPMKQKRQLWGIKPIIMSNG